MKPQYIEFLNQANRVVADPLIRSQVIAAAVAVALARSTNLPSSEVENAEGYFTGQLLPVIQRQISAFNEEVVFDTTACLSQTRQLWHLRYGSAFGVAGMLPPECTAGFFDSFTGVDRFIDDKFKVFACENGAAIASLSSFALGVIECEKGL